MNIRSWKKTVVFQGRLYEKIESHYKPFKLDEVKDALMKWVRG